ncbi:HNH endonuclease signature motif containing protein [Micrococcoides hystricis]|uniref:DUF222 domain-containing protein n=1 Tax=Micrococcoides hystricis TaxID=1572761 RepID=A0ABV6P7J0_9MICC
MSTHQHVIAGIDLDAPETAAELAEVVAADELAIRKATAKAYLHGFQFLLAQAREHRTSMRADQLTAHYLQHIDKGKLMRQSVPAYARLRRLTEAKAQNFLLLAVNLILHAPNLVEQLHHGQIPLEHVRAAGEKLKSIPPPRPDQDWTGQPWQDGHYEDAVARTDAAKNDLGSKLEDLAAPDIPETEYTSKAAQLRDAHHPENQAARHRAARAKRCVRISPAADGMANLSAHISAGDAATIQRALNDVARTKSPSDQRTLTQRQADLFVELLTVNKHTVQDSEPASAQGCGCQKQARPTRRIFAYLMITLDQWLSLGGTLKANQFEFLTPPAASQNQTRNGLKHKPSSSVLGQQHKLSAPELARLLQQVSTLQAVLTHPASGYPIGLSVRTRRPAPRIRDLLLLRDQHCRFPGCRVPGTECEVDHVNDFALGGTSELYGLALLCKKHHGGKSAGWWEVSLRPERGDGVLEFRFPQTGQSEFTYPRLPLHPNAWEQIRQQLEEPPF